MLRPSRAFSNMVVESYTDESATAVGKIHRHTYRFIRSPTYLPPTLTPSSNHRSESLLSGHLSKNDPVSVSIEPDLLSLARGFILDLSPWHITLGLDHKLDVDKLLSRLSGQFDRLGFGGQGLTRGDPAEQVFRIDRDELALGMGRIRDNLAQLFYVEGDERRRELVVDLKAPRFDETWAPKEEELAPTLNDDQRAAVHKVLTATDYALILGMPGTGKTTTIVEIIVALVKRGKSVLLTSYTHSAVDTILVKLLDRDLKLLRLGNPDKVRPFLPDLNLTELTTGGASRSTLMSSISRSLRVLRQRRCCRWSSTCCRLRSWPPPPSRSTSSSIPRVCRSFDPSLTSLLSQPGLLSTPLRLLHR